ncbi:DUF4434 domain-containing protein [Pedococcus sp. 5OH_020]|uniref:DUF4434 domain-containing protein n=1 Tax=Pedococcus sp. 5OH_020 TaxID=2989814 RepID=UPI0022E9B68F|nr:DUF4434 domain-containing protein [Pedococcus sp. 5OH_020]
MNRWTAATAATAFSACLALGAVPVAPAAQAAAGNGRCSSSSPSFSGSFIQPDLVDRWTDAQLSAEMRVLKKACITEEVIQWTADTGASPATRIYPSSQAPQSTKTDVVGRILAAAHRQGIKVYLGLQTNNDWWTNYANDQAWLDEQAAYANELANDLWKRYGSYKGTLAGWYLSFEVDNFNFPSSTTWDRMRSFYRTVGAHLDHLTPGKPVVISPFYNTSGGLTASQWSTMWRDILLGSHVDVVALQDGVGAGHATTDQLPAWFGATRMAIEKASPTTQLWADTETFIPASTGFLSMPTAQVVADMRAERPYVDRYWSFSYDHYYSPVVVNPAYDKTYRAYLKSGHVDSQAPSAPSALTATASDPQTVRLQWQGASDNIGVTRYRIYRDGTLMRQLPVADQQKAGASVSYSDAQLDPGKSYMYTVVAEDAAGNSSASSEPATATLGDAPSTPVNLSQGRGYACSLPGSSSYPDDGTKLTDGRLGTTTFTDPAWTGRLTGSPFSCAVDLGAVSTVNEVSTRWLQDPGTGIVLPSSVVVEVSTDGQNYTPLGSMAAPSLGDQKAVATFRLINVSAVARFVRLTVNPTGAGWSFTDELEVRQQASS